MVIEIQDLVKEYGNIRALDGLNLTLENGIYGLLGPNGAGKSTMISILTDNVRKSSGMILCDGEDIVQMGGKYREKIGYMPQVQSCYNSFTAKEFLEYMAAMKGMDRRKRETGEEIDLILQEVNLYEKRNQKIGGFSGGMKRRVLLAQSLLGQPEFLILDEPTAGLDPKERIALRNCIARSGRNRIVLVATHIVSDIECLADFIILMDKGKVIRCDTPGRLLEDMGGKVGSVHCSGEDVQDYQEKYCVSSIVQGKNDFILHLVGRQLSDEADMAHVDVTLEDVYMYYFGTGALR